MTLGTTIFKYAMLGNQYQRRSHQWNGHHKFQRITTGLQAWDNEEGHTWEKCKNVRVILAQDVLNYYHSTLSVTVINVNYSSAIMSPVLFELFLKHQQPMGSRET